MASYIVTGKAIGRQRTPPYSLVATAAIGDIVTLTLTTEDEATLVGSGTLALIGSLGPSEIAWAETSDTTTVRAGTTALLLSTTYPASALYTSLGLYINLPCVEYLAAQGGETLLNVNYGAALTKVPAGRVRAKSPSAWPVALSRTATPPTDTGDVVVQLEAQSISQDVTLYAGAGYGPISLRILAIRRV
jgi:hypothetical protein